MENTPTVYVRDLLLKHNRSNPLCSDRIADLLNKDFKPERPYQSIHIRKIVNDLRNKEIPVIANNKGYFISYDPEDILYQIDSLEKRIEAIQWAQSGLKQVFTTILKSN